MKIFKWISLLLVSAYISIPLKAGNFIGFAQPGLPGGWAFETWPGISRPNNPDDGNVSIHSPTYICYFSKTGFTGTTRDQFEVWFGGDLGHTKPAAGTSDRGFGFASPTIGGEYYYNVMEPKAPYQSPGYKTFWTSPAISLTIPSGNTNNSGFGSGTNQYSIWLTDNNYLGIGKFGATFAPIAFWYAFPNQNADATGHHTKIGLCMTLADIAAGYQVDPALMLGVHHSYSVNCKWNSDFDESREGKIGPSFSYSGLFTKHKILISGNLDFDYYTSNNRKPQTQLDMVFVKYF